VGRTPRHSGSPADGLHVLLRRRLLREAHDFEGLSLRPILADLDDLAVAHGVDLGLWNLHRLLAAVWPPRAVMGITTRSSASMNSNGSTEKSSNVCAQSAIKEMIASTPR
jgi:hypothetical protein